MAIQSIFDGLEHVVRNDEALAPYTWFRLGGAAQYFAEPTTREELAALVGRCREQELPVRLLGGGSNLLVRDEGVAGLVIHLAAPVFGEISVQGNALTAGGGARLGHVVSTAVREGLSGLEPLAGIPGTIGGALHGNAGSHGCDIGQWTASAVVMTHAGEIHERKAAEMNFSYRRSSLDELVILSARLELEPGDPRELTRTMQKHWIVKKAEQPLGEQCAGCVFKNPSGVSAASLIEQAGLKGTRVGGAEVSERHANFVVAHPGAKAEDVLKLIEVVRAGVQNFVGIELELEIDIW